MDDYFMMRSQSHVPAFGSWDSGEYLPFTQCFETARQGGGGLLRYTFPIEEDEEGDLYVTGDLYQNDVVTPAVIFVPRSRSKLNQTRQRHFDAKKQSKCDTSNVPSITSPSPMQYAKPVDEDLYKISPDLLRKNANKHKKRLGLFASCCLVSTCD